MAMLISHCASTANGSSPRKIYLISDIKLIRTDTTLDLSQKAEKGMSLWLPWPWVCSFIRRTKLDLQIWVIEWSDVEREPIPVTSASQ